jgi:hypothetical protein
MFVEYQQRGKKKIKQQMGSLIAWAEFLEA